MRPDRVNEPLDSWALLSILLCGRKGGALRDIVACGDYANHAVFPFQRLREGLFALQKAGLISCEDGCYQASPRASRFWREFRKKERRLLKAWGLLDQWLGKQNMSPVAGNARRLTKKKYDEAVKDYLDNF
jgi:hypothetical protein